MGSWRRLLVSILAGLLVGAVLGTVVVSVALGGGPLDAPAAFFGPLAIGAVCSLIGIYRSARLALLAGGLLGLAIAWFSSPDHEDRLTLYIGTIIFVFEYLMGFLIGVALYWIAGKGSGGDSADRWPE